MQWRDVLPYIGDPAGPDTTAGLSDMDIARALTSEPIPLRAAMLLSERHGRIVAAADVRHRIAAAPLLQRVQQLAEQAKMQDAVANCHRAIAKQRVDRQREVVEWHRLHQERMHQAALRYMRTHGPRCGAKTRSGAACKRKPVLGKSRCPNHGGCSTGPRTPEGRERALAALDRGRETQRLRRLPNIP